MSATGVLFLSAIVCAFAVFMISLAWAERQTRNLSPSLRPTEARASIQAARPIRT
ncbi:hypothetical protein [Kaistia granuli]|uniref:hypothetical protein n=1 Tax=Kaistia granuli TaxID=363259 RepID=UPI000373B384|nr:hypothetical protein [Kaistia granuli]